MDSAPAMPGTAQLCYSLIREQKPIYIGAKPNSTTIFAQFVYVHNQTSQKPVLKGFTPLV